MRYGIENNRPWIKGKEFFPAQSSVLDEDLLLSHVLKNYCIPEPVSCRFLSRGASDIYRVKTGTENFYLKIYRPPASPILIQAEALFVDQLSIAGVPVVKPVLHSEGKFVFQVTASEGIRPMLLFEEAPPPLPSKLNTKLLFQIGEKVALVHKIADELDINFGIPEINIKTFLQERVFYASQFLTDIEITYLQDISVSLERFFEIQPRNSPQFGLCHSDLVMSNIRLSSEGTITLFDFGEAKKIWRSFDLAIIYWSLGNRFKDDRSELWNAFLQGYDSIRPIPEDLTKNLTILLVLRQLAFIGGNCATLPLRLGTEVFETGFMEKQMKRLKNLVEKSNILDYLN